MRYWDHHCIFFSFSSSSSSSCARLQWSLIVTRLMWAMPFNPFLCQPTISSQNSMMFFTQIQRHITSKICSPLIIISHHHHPLLDHHQYHFTLISPSKWMASILLIHSPMTTPHLTTTSISSNPHKKT